MFKCALFSIRIGSSVVIRFAEKITDNVFQFLLFSVDEFIKFSNSTFYGFPM